MSASTDFDYDADTDEQDPPDPAAERRAAFERRKSEREKAKQEAEETKAENARLKRELAMRDVLPTLKAEGPLNTFLKHYDGEPTADAIRKAVAEDEDFKSLITFAPDPRDEAARQQHADATKMRGGDTLLGKVEADVTPGTGRLRHAYDTPTKTA